MCVIYFKDGKPLHCPSVTLYEMYILYRVVRTAKVKATCQIKTKKGLSRVDVYDLDPRRTFNNLYDLTGVLPA